MDGLVRVLFSDALRTVNENEMAFDGVAQLVIVFAFLQQVCAKNGVLRDVVFQWIAS